MKYCYVHNGTSYHTVDDSYVAQTGEVLFYPQPDDAALTAAFPLYLSAKAAVNAQTVFGVALQSGLTIASPSAPSLNGLYGVGPQDQFNLAAEAVNILTTGKFTSGGVTRNWPDVTGGYHTMTIVQFQAFAVAVGAYIDALTTALQTATAGGTPTWPPSSSSIP